MLAGDTVIAKDVDSRRQLTAPLKSFIYAPEREQGSERVWGCGGVGGGGARGGGEGGEAECRAPNVALKSSRLTSSLSSRATRLIDCLGSPSDTACSSIKKEGRRKHGASSSLRLGAKCTE